MVRFDCKTKMNFYVVKIYFEIIHQHIFKGKKMKIKQNLIKKVYIFSYTHRHHIETYKEM